MDSARVIIAQQEERGNPLPLRTLGSPQSGERDRLTETNCSFFKTLIDHEVTVELKNDIQLRGTLKSVDQYLNIKLDDISVVEELKYPHMVRSRSYAVTAP